jgi:hypothetical protein
LTPIGAIEVDVASLDEGNDPQHLVEGRVVYFTAPVGKLQEAIGGGGVGVGIGVGVGDGVGHEPGIKHGGILPQPIPLSPRITANITLARFLFIHKPLCLKTLSMA